MHLSKVFVGINRVSFGWDIWFLCFFTFLFSFFYFRVLDFLININKIAEFRQYNNIPHENEELNGIKSTYCKKARSNCFIGWPGDLIRGSSLTMCIRPVLHFGHFLVRRSL